MKISNLHNLFLIIIFILSFALRFYKLGEVPNGFYQDESAIGYNAYSILQTGKDEHGEFFPIYFKSFGDYKLPLYIYTTALSVSVLGLNEFAVRFPSALFGLLTVIVFYFFLKELTGDKRLSIISVILLSVNPWHLHYSRATFEVSISLFLFVLGSLFLLLSFRKKVFGFFLLGTICFIINLYTYNLTRLLAPVLYFVFVFSYFRSFRTVDKLEKRSALIISIIVLLPFFLTLLKQGGFSSAGGTLIFSSAFVQAPLLELRSYMVSLPVLISKLFFNMSALTIFHYLENIVSYFSVQFFFLSGSLHGNHGIGNVGQFYLFELLSIPAGIYVAMREKKLFHKLLISWTIAVVLVASLTREAPHATRSFFLLVPMVVLSAIGFLIICSLILSVKSSAIKNMLFAFFAILIVYNVVYYFTSYYVRFPLFYAKAWRSEDKRLSLYIREHENQYDKIIFDKRAGFIYTSLLFYTKYSPSDFQKSVVYERDNSEGFSMPISFGKYIFKDIDWENDYKEKRTLVITSPDIKPEYVSTLKTLYYPKRPVVLSVRQEIIAYPVEEVAYVLVETK